MSDELDSEIVFTELEDADDFTPEYRAALAEFNSTPARVQVRSVRFTQNSISTKFSNGKSVQAEIDRIFNGNRDAPARAEAIRRDGDYSVIKIRQDPETKFWHSLDNRRLFVAKQVLRTPETGRGAGPIQEILVVRLTAPFTAAQDKEWNDKFHPTDHGLTIRFGQTNVSFPA